MIFLRPRYLRLRQQYSRRQAFVQAIWNPDDAPSGTRNQLSDNNRRPINGAGVAEQNVEMAVPFQPGNEVILEKSVEEEAPEISLGSSSMRLDPLATNRMQLMPQSTTANPSRYPIQRPPTLL